MRSWQHRFHAGFIGVEAQHFAALQERPALTIRKRLIAEPLPCFLPVQHSLTLKVREEVQVTCSLVAFSDVLALNHEFRVVVVPHRLDENLTGDDPLNVVFGIAVVFHFVRVKLHSFSSCPVLCMP